MNNANKKTLTLSTHRGKWRNRAGGEPADTEFQKVKPSILAKDGHKCVYCGLRIEGMGSNGQLAMEVHHSDNNHENNNPKNLDTTDHFCHAYNHIGFLSTMAVMGYAPEVSIEDMNHLLRTVGVAMMSDDEEMKVAAKEIYDQIRQSSDDFASVWGTKNPADIGNALLALPNSSYDVRDITLAGARLIFDLENPVNMTFLKTTAIKAHAAMPIQSWPDIAAQFLTENLDDWAAAGKDGLIGSEELF